MANQLRDPGRGHDLPFGHIWVPVHSYRHQFSKKIMMTEDQVVHIVNRTVQPFVEVIQGLQSTVGDKMSTRDVMKFFGKSKHWVHRRRMELGGERINRRGDFEFSTHRVLQYKMNHSKTQL